MCGCTNWVGYDDDDGDEIKGTDWMDDLMMCGWYGIISNYTMHWSFAVSGYKISDNFWKILVKA